MKIVQTRDTLSPIYIDALRIRSEVFMKEQHVPLNEEVDQYEAYCIHFVYYDDFGNACGTCRLLPQENHVMKLQRMAVLKPYRHHQIGDALVKEAENFSKTHDGQIIILGAQLTALGFYEKLGYQVTSEIFLDAGIEHKMMQKNII